MIEDGVATAEEIDRATRFGLGLRFAAIGVVEFIDFGGADILHHASREMAGSIDAARYAAPPVIGRMMDEGRLGLKSGQGFYDYRGRDVGAYRRDVLARTLAQVRDAGLWRPPAGRRCRDRPRCSARDERARRACRPPRLRRCGARPDALRRVRRRPAPARCRSCCCTRRRAAGASTPRCCRCSARIAARSPSTPPASASPTRWPRRASRRGPGRRSQLLDALGIDARPRRRPPHRRRDRGRAGGARARRASPRSCSRRRRTPSAAFRRARAERAADRRGRAERRRQPSRRALAEAPAVLSGRAARAAAGLRRRRAESRAATSRPGHRAVASYRMEDRSARVRAPVLLAARERRSVRRAAPRRVAPPAARGAASRRSPAACRCPTSARASSPPRCSRFLNDVAPDDRVPAMAEAMRIHAWGEPPRLEDLPEPAPRPGRTLVRMAATTASHLDRSIAAGGFLRHPPLPYVPGVEAAGTVLQSERFAVGARVWLRGAGLGTSEDGTWRETISAPDAALGRAARRDRDAARRRLLLAVHGGVGGAVRRRRAAGRASGCWSAARAARSARSRCSSRARRGARVAVAVDAAGADDGFGDDVERIALGAGSERGASKTPTRARLRPADRHRRRPATRPPPARASCPAAAPCSSATPRAAASSSTSPS